MSRLIKTALVIIVIVLGSLVYCWTPLRLRFLVLVGRSPVCPYSQAIRCASDLRLQVQTKDRILAASRLVERDPAGFELWDTPYGRYWLPKSNQYVLPYDLAEQERNIYGTGERAVRAGDIVLDCGANVGVYVRKALAAGAKTVVAIELAPENLECLRRTFTAEVKDGRVVIYPKGVWDKDDVLTLNVVADNSAADTLVLQAKGAREGPKVPLTTIDKLVAELKLERVDFIKMDIEGAEQKALAGAHQTLARYRPRLALSSYHLPSDPEEIPRVVHRAVVDYRMECGPCEQVGWYVRPNVLYFR